MYGLVVAFNFKKLHLKIFCNSKYNLEWDLPVCISAWGFCCLWAWGWAWSSGESKALHRWLTSRWCIPASMRTSELSRTSWTVIPMKKVERRLILFFNFPPPVSACLGVLSGLNSSVRLSIFRLFFLVVNLEVPLFIQESRVRVYPNTRHPDIKSSRYPDILVCPIIDISPFKCKISCI